MARKPKTQDLPAMEGPGVAAPSCPAVEKAADKYLNARNERMGLTEKEVETRAVLVHVMKENKITIYKYDGHVVELTTKEKLKVKNETDEDGELED